MTFLIIPSLLLTWLPPTTAISSLPSPLWPTCLGHAVPSPSVLSHYYLSCHHTHPGWLYSIPDPDIKHASYFVLPFPNRTTTTITQRKAFLQNRTGFDDGLLPKHASHFPSMPTMPCLLPNLQSTHYFPYLLHTFCICLTVWPTTCLFYFCPTCACALLAWAPKPSVCLTCYYHVALL